MATLLMTGAAKVNHPLNDKGVEQCQLLNARYKDALASASSDASSDGPSAGDPLFDFHLADAVYASPLTRFVIREPLTNHNPDSLSESLHVALAVVRRKLAWSGCLDTRRWNVG
eukprot:SAG31_NODE_4789_length_2955_cov_1.493347_3_plen_114_part_00